MVMVVVVVVEVVEVVVVVVVVVIVVIVGVVVCEVPIHVYLEFCNHSNSYINQHILYT